MKLIAVAILTFPILANAARIAITIDDIPYGWGIKYNRVERTDKIVEALDATGIKNVIAFTNVSDHTFASKQISRYNNAGHIIGNHTSTHISLQETTADEFIKSIDECDKSLSNYSNYKRIFRFPNGTSLSNNSAREKEVHQYLKQNGYRNGPFTIDGLDWFYRKLMLEKFMSGKKVKDWEKVKQLYASSIIDFVESVEKLPNHRDIPHVLLLHERDVTAYSLRHFIDKARERGHTFIAPEKAMSELVRLNVTDPDSFNSKPLENEYAKIRADIKKKIVLELEGLFRDMTTEDWIVYYWNRVKYKAYEYFSIVTGYYDK